MAWPKSHMKVLQQGHTICYNNMDATNRLLCLEIWSLAGVLEDVQLSGGGAWLEEVGLREGEGWGKAGFEL